MLAQLAPIPTDQMDLRLSMSTTTEAEEQEREQQQTLEQEIAELEKRLDQARARLKSQRPDTPPASSDGGGDALPSPVVVAAPLPPATHFLLLLSDSALPLGAFAFSSGLESFLAHTNNGTNSIDNNNKAKKEPPAAAFTAFLPASVSAFASTSLPFALAAHRDPARLVRLDDALDATVVCAVGRRASVAQGRALLSVWERCFAPALLASPSPAAAAITSFAAAVRAAPAASGDDNNDPPPSPAAHLAPLFGAVCRAAGLDAREAAAVLVLGHVKALVSAAVRAGVFGPYQAQRLLAGARVRELVDAAVRREWDTPVELAGQSVPVMDLWLGRHELLYSRIFNS